MNTHDKQFWDEFYKNQIGIEHNSDFSEYIYTNYLKKYNESNIFMKIGDFGCGNCRDSNFFAGKGNMVIAVDKSGVNKTPSSNCTLIIDDVKDVVTLNTLNTLLDVVYMRWFLHATPYYISREIFNNSINMLKPGGIMCIEVRSLKDNQLLKKSTFDKTDKSYTTTHKRWPYNKGMLNRLCQNKDVEILECNEGYFSPLISTETENPLLIRFIIKKKIIPHYQQSVNYKLYKHIVPVMRDDTLLSYKHMDLMNAFLEKHSIKYVAVAGTIIGLNRHGGIIPWDNDIDIGFIASEWEKLLTIKDELESIGLKYTHKGGNHCHFGNIDCFLLYSNGDYYEGPAKTFCHKEEYENVYKQIFGYTYIYAPWCSVKSLSHRYGENYFKTGDVNDNFHFKDSAIERFSLQPNDLSYQVI